MKLVYKGLHKKDFRVTGKLNGINTWMIISNLTPHIETQIRDLLEVRDLLKCR